MKLLQSKKIIAGLLLGLFTLFSIPLAIADENNDTSEPPTAAATSSDSQDSTKQAPATAQDAIGNMLLQSVSLMGIAYKWGGNTPDTGMDCSGFVRYVFKRSLGINLPRTAAEMAKVGKRVSIDDLEPGDLIFFNTRRGSNTHIGIYLGNNKFIQSPRTGENIQISDLSGYWVKHFNGAKRVVQENQDDSGNTTVESYQDVRNEALPSNHTATRARRSKTSKSSHHYTTHSRAKSVKATKHSKSTKKKSKKQTH